MPHSSDDPPSGPSAETLASEAPVTGRPDPDSGDVSQRIDPPTPLQQDDGEPRRPRRRRPPPASRLQTGSDTQIEQTAASGETALVESSPNASPSEGEPQKPP